MEGKTLEVLLVDDHKMTLIGYKTALAELSFKRPRYQFNITEATSIDAALYFLDGKFKFKQLDLVFLDIQLPKDLNHEYQSGEDLGVLVRQHFPNSKIIIITTFDNSLLIRNLLESINPEGLLIKSDVVPENFIQAVLDVIEDPPYYSKTVTKFLRKQHGLNYYLDRLDRLIIYYISIGKQTKDLPQYVPLSLPGIERRKKRLKEIFEVEDGNDIHLITRAREEGFL